MTDKQQYVRDLVVGTAIICISAPILLLVASWLAPNRCPMPPTDRPWEEITPPAEIQEWWLTDTPNGPLTAHDVEWLAALTGGHVTWQPDTLVVE